jgi:hypothetical protein
LEKAVIFFTFGDIKNIISDFKTGLTAKVDPGFCFPVRFVLLVLILSVIFRGLGQMKI